MQFNYRTTAYLEGLQSVLIKSGFEITGFDWPREVVYINKVEHWKKRNGKVVKVFHHFQTSRKIPPEMIKWRKVKKEGYSHSWVYADDPHYTYEANERFITRGDAKRIIEIYKTLPIA